MIRSKQFFSNFPWLLISFILCGLYWAYQLLLTETLILYDSVGYENFGEIFASGQWQEYFTSGPNREPLYSLTISLSMRAADLLGVPYLVIQKIFQILILFLTQLLFLRITKELKINPWITIGGILYIGFSPSLLNSALSLYSEILTYPLILGIVLMAADCWRLILNDRPAKLIIPALALSILFLALIFTKGIYETIYSLFLIPFLCLTVYLAVRKKPGIRCSIIFLALFLVSVQSALISYKNLNKKYNGVYTLTNRGAYALGASVVRRTADVTPRKFLIASAYAAGGMDYCHRMFGAEDCAFWTVENYDLLGRRVLAEYQEKFGYKNADREIISSAFRTILAHPFQFGSLMTLDWLKMFFWESTHIGFVVYPDWLEKIYNNPLFSFGLSLVIGLLTLASSFYLLVLTYKNRKGLISSENSSPSVLYLSAALIIHAHVLLYSLFFTLPRWAFPVAPLYLLAIVLFLNALTVRIPERPIKTAHK